MTKHNSLRCVAGSRPRYAEAIAQPIMELAPRIADGTALLIEIYMADLRCYNSNCNTSLQKSDEICPRCHNPQILNSIYRIQGILGNGGFGCVYDAIDTHLSNRRCAIKEIIARPLLLTHDQIVQEVHLLSSNASNLPFMPDIYTYWQDGTKHYIVMQYIDGQTVGETRKLPWAPDEVLHFVREMLKHLTQLHSVDVVHRDIKPANIKHTTRRGYVLLDFGLATIGGISIIQGATPDYAPIEQFYDKRPANTHTGPRSDLYSLAATAYYLLTKTKPTRADERKPGQALPPPRHADGVPAALEKTLLWMLELMPADRPASAQAALDHLNSPNEMVVSPNPPPQPVQNEISTAPKGFEEASKPPIIPPTQNHYQQRRAKPDRGRLNSIAWSPDGKQIAVASALGFSIYDVQSQQELYFENLRSPVGHVSYTLNGTALALATPGGVQLVQASDHQRLTTLKCYPNGSDCTMVGAPRGQLLAIATDKDVRLWKADEAKLVTILEEELANYIALSAGGERLAIATHNGIQIWELRNGQLGQMRSLPLTGASVVKLTFSFDGGFLAVATTQEVSIWRTSDRSRICKLDGNEIKGAVTGVALTPDGKLLAVAAGGRVALWSVQPQRLVRTLAEGSSDIIDLEFAPDGQSLAAASQAQIWVWRVSDGSSRLTRHDHLESMHSVTFSPDGQRLAAMGGRAYVWDLRDKTMMPLHILAGQSDQQNGVAFDPTGQTLAAASHTSIRIWNINDGKILHETPSGAAQAGGVAFTDGGRTLLSVAADAVEYWHSHYRMPAHTLPHPQGGPYDIALAQDGQFIATFAGRTVSVRQSDGSLRCTLEIDSEINSVALTLDGQHLAVATDRDTQIWSISEPHRPLKHYPEWAQRVIFSPDGNCLALLRDATILLWQLEEDASGQLLPLIGHTEMVNDAAFAPDGNMLASASQDGTVRLWIWKESPMAQDQPDTPFYVQLGTLGHPARLNVASAETPWEIQVSDELVAHEGFEPSISLSQVHLKSEDHPAKPDAPSVYIFEDVLRRYEVFEKLILHKDYQRLWGALAHMPGGRYLLTGYGSFGGTSLIKCAMEKARKELHESGYSNGPLLAIHFKVTEEASDHFEVKADTLTIGHPDLPAHLKNKDQWEALKTKVGQFGTTSEPIDLPLRDSLSMTFFNMSDNTNHTAAARANDYDFAQFINDINSLFKQGADDVTLKQVIARFIGSKILSTRLIIIIDKVHYIETITRLTKLNLFNNDNVLVVVVSAKEDLDRWGETTTSLEKMGFTEWYVPCLWEINFENLFTQINSPQSVDFNAKVNIFQKYLEYSGRGSFGRIISKLRDPKNVHYKAGSGFIDVIELCEQAKIRHDAWMQEVLNKNWEIILENLFGGGNQEYRTDRAKIGVYYIFDRISTKIRFTEQEIHDEAQKTPITISSDQDTVAEVIRNILHVLVWNSYLKLEIDRYQVAKSKDYSQRTRRAPSRIIQKVLVQQPPENPKVNTLELYRLLRQCFNDSELRDLCFKLNIEYESLPGQNIGDKTRELVEYTERRGRINELVDLCRQIRSHTDWGKAYQAISP